MNLSHSVREISYNSFTVVDADGVEISNQLSLEKAADMVRRFENADRLNQGKRLLTMDDMPEVLAALAGTKAQEAADASRAHTWETCKNGCTPGGRKCNESIRLWEAAHQLLNWTRAPFATKNRWGHRHGHLTMAVAVAEIGNNGGSIIKAPAGAYEAELAARAERKAADDARLAARRDNRLATSRPMPRRRF
jgi:hypothetical protein